MTKLYYKAGSIIIRDAVSSDTFELREADKKEIQYSHHRTPKQALAKGFAESTLCLTVEVEGHPVGMFGIVPQTILSKTASIWLLGSSEIEKIQKTFLKNSRKFIDLFLSYYPYLENFVSCERKRTLKWLKHIGATIETPKPYGIEGRLFHHFYFRREA